MDAVVHRRMDGAVRRDPAARLEDPPEQRHTVEVEADRGRDPLGAEQCERDGERDAPRPGPVGVRYVGAEGEHECEHDAGRDDGVHRLRIEIVLVDHAGDRDDQAQHARGDREPARLRRDGEEHRDRDQRRGEVRLDQRT